MINQHYEPAAEPNSALTLEELQRRQRANAPTVRDLRRAMAQLLQREVIAASDHTNQREPASPTAKCLPP